jgi:hypothetical protein
MIRLPLPTVALVACALLNCCTSGPSYKIELENSDERLTNEPEDPLFRLVVLHAPEPLALADLRITVGYPGQIEHVVNFDVEKDRGTRSSLEVGGSLLAIEPASNLFGPEEAGVTFNVHLLQRYGPGEKELWVGRWTPDR